MVFLIIYLLLWLALLPEVWTTNVVFMTNSIRHVNAHVRHLFLGLLGYSSPQLYCGSVTEIPIIHVFVIVFVTLHIDILSFLFIVLNSIGVLLIICSLNSWYIKKNATSILVIIVLGVCV